VEFSVRFILGGMTPCWSPSRDLSVSAD